MILYLDTSALVKLYIEESGTSAVAAAVERAAAVATARITYAEARSAFARYARGGGLAPAELRRVVRQLDQEWGHYSLVEISDAVVRRAGALAEDYKLRGYDAVQLAAAVDLRRGADAVVAFASFDARLNQAARRESLGLL